MCNPLALGLAQGGLSLIGSAAEVNAQNEASDRNRQHSIRAMNEEQADSMARYVEDQRSLIQGSFDAILEGRAEEATAYASAVQNGVTGSSVKAVLRDSRQKTGRSTSRTKQEMSSLRTQTGNQQKHIRSKAQGRINQVPRTSLNMGHIASAISPIIRSQA